MDQLAILGKGVDHEDQIEYILEGLPEDYKTVVDQIEGRDTPPTITELHEKLLNHEAKLLVATEVVPASTPITANVAQQRGNNNYQSRQHSNYQRNNNSPRPNNNNYPPRTDNRAPKPYLGRCQICGVQGHSAKRCTQLLSYQSQHQLQATPFKQYQPRANYASGLSYSPESWLLDSGANSSVP